MALLDLLKRPEGKTIEQLRQRPDLAEALLGLGLGVSVRGLGQDHELSSDFIEEGQAMAANDAS